MQQLSSKEDLFLALEDTRKLNARIGFVPTMGYLHEGHLSLVSLAKKVSDKTVVSIFVNPTQFNNPEDFKKYPIDLKRDLMLLEEAGVDFVYTPSLNDIYPAGFTSGVKAGSASNGFEGEFRPGHFDGVVTVVSILLNQVQPTTAIFGEKDFQQLNVIEQLVRDLSIPVKILRAPLLREVSGLAMSSRNVRLSEEGKIIASKIFQGLSLAKEEFLQKKIIAADIATFAKNIFKNHPAIQVEYLDTVDDNTVPRILFAGYVEGVRLIDTVLCVAN